MRKKTLRRPLAMLLAFALCTGMLSLPALAQEQDAELTAPSDVSSDMAEETKTAEAPLADAGSWKIQLWGGKEDIALQEDWLVPDEDGNGITVNYNLMADDPGSVVVYDSSGADYQNSTLEFDLTMTERQEITTDTFQVAIFPRFVDGQNCDGLGINKVNDLQHSYRVNNSEGWPTAGNEANLTFEVGTTYHFRVETVGDTMTFYVTPGDGEEVKLTSFTAESGITSGTYGFRFWGYQKVVKIDNITRTELEKDSSLLETEKEIKYEEWGTADVVIPMSLKEGDSVASVSNGDTLLTGETDYTLSEDAITLKADYIGAQQDSFTLTVKFASQVENTYQLTRAAKTVEADGWVVQRQGETKNEPLREGWITVSEDGKKVVIDYGKMIEDTGNQGWVVFDGDAEQYQNSSLEYDITFSNSEDGEWIATAPATRVTAGADYEGFAITDGSGLERTGRKNGSESYAGVSNLAGIKFEYGKTYHLRMETVGNNITVYVTEEGGEEQKLTSFESPIGLEKGSYGFRFWRGGKTVTLENIERREIVISKLGSSIKQIEKENWGTEDVTVPVNFGTGDTVASIYNEDVQLVEGEDYTVSGDVLTVKKEYIAASDENIHLTVNFTKGSEADLWIIQYDPSVQQEYVWTPDQGIDMWVRMDGDGIYRLEEDGLYIKDKNVLVNTQVPAVTNGEIEIVFELLDDDGSGRDGVGGLFRVNTQDNTWQSVTCLSAEDWGFLDSTGATNKITNIGTNFSSREGVKDYKVKVRLEDDSATIWFDDNFVCTGPISQAKASLGNMGLLVDNGGEVLVKKVTFREVYPFTEETGERETVSIANDGLTVRLDSDFPRVAEYELNGKTLNGSEVRYNYVTINTMDMPATAEIIEQGEDYVIYHVTPDQTRTGVTFDVKFTVLDSQILEMLILNINEPADELVYGIGLPRQPLISANSSQEGAKLDASWMDNNGFADTHETIADKNISTTADRAVTIPIISANGLSASMMNNVYVDRFEFLYRAFTLEDGSVSAGFWNTQYMYRGLDDEKILPFATEPDEENLYCRIAITEDTNDDDVVDWQDGANALKKLNSDLIPGGDQAARSFFHIGYNFSSGVQHPFLEVADSMKRLSNYLDGFSQQLIFKGYANEGHDSGPRRFPGYQQACRRRRGYEHRHCGGRQDQLQLRYSYQHLRGVSGSKDV